mmetsp:Transcript_13317/g.16668  ORF Transcript_13317/g.16668 Transcript_13317/m.16668 type:complete len:90 (-) Transcript_13317:52-321(-)
MAPLICLDPTGQSFDSIAFSEMLFQQLDAHGSRLTIGIGPAEGFSSKVRQTAYCVSLSKLTFPHQLVRVILAEQIYRASEIRRDSKYNK